MLVECTLSCWLLQEQYQVRGQFKPIYCSVNLKFPNLMHSPTVTVKVDGQVKLFLLHLLAN